MGGRAGLRVGPGFGPGVSSSSGTLRQGPPHARRSAHLLFATAAAKDVALLRLSYTPVRAFAILKRTNTDSGVCEKNAHLNKILQSHNSPRPPEVQCCSVCRIRLRAKSGRLFCSPRVPPSTSQHCTAGCGGGCVANSSTAQMGVFFADTGYKLDTVLLPKKSNPASCRLTLNYNQARPIEPLSQVLRA